MIPGNKKPTNHTYLEGHGDLVSRVIWGFNWVYYMAFKGLGFRVESLGLEVLLLRV